MENQNEFDVAEFLILNLAEEIEDDMTVVQGTSTFIPLIATKLAMEKKRFNLIGGFSLNSRIATPKIPSTFSYANYEDEKSYLGLSGFLDLLQNKKIDLEFLRPAQIDRFGNMNNTVIGAYNSPKVRLPGGMGLDDVMHFIKKIIVYVPNHSKRVFVEKVDFITASGWDKGKGPDKIITNMCVFEFINKRITLIKINPFYSLEEIKKETGFDFQISKNIVSMKAVYAQDKEKIKKIDPLNLRNLEIKEKREGILKQFR